MALRDLLDQRGLQRTSTFATVTQLPGDARSVSEQLVIASLISQIGPPPTSAGASTDGYTATTRRAMHGLDLGVWMTQPCIMVLGHLGVGGDGEGAPSPTPMTIDGRDPNLRGRTFVRWVYPLESSPPRIGTGASSDGEAADEPTSGERGPDF